MKLLSANIALGVIFIVSCSSQRQKVASEINLAVKDQNLNQVSEIALQRVYSGCKGCPDHLLTLSREKADEFSDAKVTYTELHSNKRRDGKLSAYYYNTLLKVVELQKFFEATDALEDKELKFLGWGGPASAIKLIKKSAR